jgi:uncharacterized protein (DUF4415 family)/uncharacterized DUF497 family protein
MKSRANRRKHGLDFETAMLVFDDAFALSQPDPAAEEERWRTVGLIGGVVIFVVHTWPDANETGEISGVSSVPARRPREKGKPMKKKTVSKALTAKQKADLAKLARLPEAKIDTRAIPEGSDWAGAKRGLFYRHLKQQLTLRLDADLVDWFRTRASEGRGYQTDINRALREHVQRWSRRKAG